MKGLSFRGAAAVAAVAVVATAAAGASAAAGGIQPGTQFYVAGPDPAAQQQIARLTSSGAKADATLVDAMATTAHAVWITGGSPNEARVAAQKTVDRAAGKHQLPVLALYDIPGRDCS